jgi:hypothetical protein
VSNWKTVVGANLTLQSLYQELSFKTKQTALNMGTMLVSTYKSTTQKTNINRNSNFKCVGLFCLKYTELKTPYKNDGTEDT